MNRRGATRRGDDAQPTGFARRHRARLQQSLGTDGGSGSRSHRRRRSRRVKTNVADGGAGATVCARSNLARLLYIYIYTYTLCVLSRSCAYTSPVLCGQRVRDFNTYCNIVKSQLVEVDIPDTTLITGRIDCPRIPATHRMSTSPGQVVSTYMYYNCTLFFILEREKYSDDCL